jgi:hypothetical protein
MDEGRGTGHGGQWATRPASRRRNGFEQRVSYDNDVP